MVFRCFFVFVLGSFLLLAEEKKPGKSALQPVNPAGTVWFNDVRDAVKIDASSARLLCNAAWHGLQGGDVNLGGIPLGSGPRVVVLTWSDGQLQGRSVKGSGADLGAALKDAVFAARMHDSKSLRWLKVDVVQSSASYDTFLVRESSLPLPSLIGVAFRPDSGFFFLPDQLTALRLVNDHLNMTIHPVSQQLLDENRMNEFGWWSRITSTTQPQTACFFETQAWFFDGVNCEVLYRGHRFYAYPKRDELLSAVSHCARGMAALVGDKGRIRPELPEWLTSRERDEFYLDYAGAALAFARLASADSEYAELYIAAGDRIARRLIERLEIYNGVSQASCLIDRGEGPVKNALTSTNSLTILALCALSRHGESKRYDVPLARLARFLLHQAQPSGDFLFGRHWPGASVMTKIETNSTSMAACALMALYEKTRIPSFRHAGQAAVDSLVRRCERKRADQLEVNEWLLEAIDQSFTYTRDDQLVTTAQRLALAVVTSQDRDPVFPDLFGSVIGKPSATVAAYRSRVVAIAARLLKDAGRREAALSLLAEIEPTVSFQMQARITPAEAIHLETPQKYLGLFRDHLRGFGLDTQCQYAQILSLLENARLLQSLGHDAYPVLTVRDLDDDKKIRKPIEERRAVIYELRSHFPGALAAFHGDFSNKKAFMPRKPGERGDPEDAIVAPPVFRKGRTAKEVMRPVPTMIKKGGKLVPLPEGVKGVPKVRPVPKRKKN